MNALFLVTLLFACLLIGVPIAVALGFASILTLLIFADQSTLSLAQKFFHTMQVYPLLALPFFVLAGTFMTSGGVARRMIEFANAAVGHFHGGLAMASVLACMLFAAVSGSSPATVIAIGSIVIAGMVSSGYSRNFAAGVICNAGTLGILIPPSIVMVVYGAATETSIGKLFIAGIIPGLLLTGTMMIAVYFIARHRKIPRQPWVGWWQILRTGRRALWGLLLIVIILGGIYGGVFTPTEAAAVSAMYAFVVAVYIHGDIKLKDVPEVLVSSSKITAMLLFIIANAFLFAFVLTTMQIPQQASEAIMSMGLSPWAFLLAVNVLLLIAGNFMEPTSVILILAPILFPIAMDLGIDPVHLGIIMVVNLEIGMVTPPVGLNLFVTAGVAGMSLEQVIMAALPWLLILLSVLIIVTYVPLLSLYLPSLML
ncbi:MAG: TRAP transporter large permease subunit [Xanthomonadales bacterium]